MDNKTKVRVVARQISFLMQHQTILPELRELALRAYPMDSDPDKIDYNSPEYLKGAYDALTALITSLEEKG